MKYFAKLITTLVISLLIGAVIDGAHAMPAKARLHGAKASKRTYGGEALKRKTNLKFDGRTVESLRAGKYDSLSMADGQAGNSKRLYSLPTNFAARAADAETEMRYRQ